MRPIAAALAVAVSCAPCPPALAACRWDWLCNGEGACKQMPVCDSVRETPPMIERGQVGPSPRAMRNLSPVITPPAPPPLAMRPVRSAGAGRSGLACEHVMRPGRGGRWSWSEACYCVDKSRNPDASRPFAHIVRCDDPRAQPGAPPGR